MRTPAGFEVPTGTAVVGDFESIRTLMFGPRQHDDHMTIWRHIQKFYGTPAEFMRQRAEAQAAKAEARARLEQTPEGRAWLAQLARDHAEQGYPNG